MTATQSGHKTSAENNGINSYEKRKPDKKSPMSALYWERSNLLKPRTITHTVVLSTYSPLQARICQHFFDNRCRSA